jgi:hypothetical protein
LYQNKQRASQKTDFFIQGEPKAVIMLEVASHNSMEDEIQANDLIALKEIILGMFYQKIYEQILIK